jgi:hypothetical protein
MTQQHNSNHLLHAYYRHGPEEREQQEAVFRTFNQLCKLGEVNPTTGALKEQPKCVMDLEWLGHMCASGKLDSGNYYLVAQIMRLSMPKKGKVYALPTPVVSNQEAGGPSSVPPTDSSSILLGRYDCMVSLR